MINDIFLKLMFNILENYMTFTMIHHFYLKEGNLKKVEKAVLLDKSEYVIHIRNLKHEALI